MMEKELCFIINNKNIYRDHILVEYNSIPIFFVCKDDVNYYIVQCVDIDNFKYIISSISLSDLFLLLHGNLSMRDIFLKQSTYWEVETGEEIENDHISEYVICNLKTELLPEEGAYFQVLTDATRAYVKEVDNLCLLDDISDAIYSSENTLNENIFMTDLNFEINHKSQECKSTIPSLDGEQECDELIKYSRKHEVSLVSSKDIKLSETDNINYHLITLGVCNYIIAA